MIDNFTGQHYFLSNFYPCEILWKGQHWKTSEHIFQAEKSNNRLERQLIRSAPSPGMAKRLGRRVTLQPDWDNKRDDIMYEIVLQKFKQHKDIRKLLLKTGDQELIEGNTWGDTYWGVCKSVGQNKLGKILMRVREEIRHHV